MANNSQSQVQITKMFNTNEIQKKRNKKNGRDKQKENEEINRKQK